MTQHAAVIKKSTVTRITEVRKAMAYNITRPVVRLLARTRLTPDAVSWIGFLLTLGAVSLIVTGHLFAGGWVVLIAGFFDMLDGALARLTNQTTLFGGVLDSTLDRLSEATLLLGILIFYVLSASERPVMPVSLVSLALVGSFLVSYVRARAEGAGLECQEGFFTRAERVIVLALGLLLSQFAYALVIALSVIAVLSFITVGQRLYFTWQRAKLK